jgi:hypothetical protein
LGVIAPGCVWHSTGYEKSMVMLPMLAVVPMVAAIGYSIIYLLLGGGFGGAVVIFIIAKMFGK